MFDQGNKGWKAIPNALKGLVVEDDDQQSLELALLSTPDSDEELNADYILPAAFDPRVKDAVAKATLEAARRSGVARL